MRGEKGGIEYDKAVVINLSYELNALKQRILIVLNLRGFLLTAVVLSELG